MKCTLEELAAGKVKIELDDKALDKACLIVENAAKENCPVGDTGQLRRSITHRVEGDTGYIYTNTEYAPYVEYGTGIYAAAGNGRKDVPWFYQDAKGEWHATYGNHPQPFLHPALENNVPEIQKILGEGVHFQKEQ